MTRSIKRFAGDSIPLHESASVGQTGPSHLSGAPSVRSGSHCAARSRTNTKRPGSVTGAPHIPIEAVERGLPLRQIPAFAFSLSGQSPGTAHGGDILRPPCGRPTAIDLRLHRAALHSRRSAHSRLHRAALHSRRSTHSRLHRAALHSWRSAHSRLHRAALHSRRSAHSRLHRIRLMWRAHQRPGRPRPFPVPVLLKEPASRAVALRPLPMEADSITPQLASQRAPLPRSLTKQRTIFARLGRCIPRLGALTVESRRLLRRRSGGRPRGPAQRWRARRLSVSLPPPLPAHFARRRQTGLPVALQSHFTALASFRRRLFRRGLIRHRLPILCKRGRAPKHRSCQGCQQATCSRAFHDVLP